MSVAEKYCDNEGGKEDFGEHLVFILIVAARQ
jgi:hypothetical protein